METFCHISLTWTFCRPGIEARAPWTLARLRLMEVGVAAVAGVGDCEGAGGGLGDGEG